MSYTSLRLDKQEAITLCQMMRISPSLVYDADKYGECIVGEIIVRKTPLEGLFTITFGLSNP